MKQERPYTELFENPGVVALKEIPVTDYTTFCDFIDLLMGEEGTHCLAYFAVPERDQFRLICCMGADENHAILLLSHLYPKQGGSDLPALSARHFQFHAFEREIHENFGIGFSGHPWLKPVRWPFNRSDRDQWMNNYPFFNIEGEELHEVGVGPIHAGIIEPGYFRFICHGEHVHHLEIHLGYQHRGVEALMVNNQAILNQMVLSESIAGDTAIGHSLAYAGLAEKLAGLELPGSLHLQRAVALELERIALHIGDTAAICNDIAYQLGQVVCEALRTIVINTTQLWCGNRFGKGMIRPAGTRYPLTSGLVNQMLENLTDVEARYFALTDRLFSLPSALGRLEGIGRITTMQASLAGLVGMAARSSGMYRDIRWSHPFGGYRERDFSPEMLPGGDVYARAMLRRREVESSLNLIRETLKGINVGSSIPAPDFNLRFQPSSLAISLTEGWRGEICHVALTDESGAIIHYKIKDPSFHNWLALALAVRRAEISDFPLCNKSFNLSYCGHDL